MEMTNSFAAINSQIDSLRTDLKTEMANLRTEIQTIRADLSKQLVDQQRWTLAYVFAMLATGMAYLKYMA